MYASDQVEREQQSAEMNGSARVEQAHGTRRSAWDLLQQQLGACRERIRELERQLEDQRHKSEQAAREWTRLVRHREELADWLIDQATNEAGRIVRSEIDAGLCGDEFVPGVLSGFAHGRRFRMELVSTTYEVKAEE